MKAFEPRKVRKDAELLQRFSATSAAKNSEELPQKTQKDAENGDGYSLMETLREVHS